MRERANPSQHAQTSLCQPRTSVFFEGFLVRVWPEVVEFDMGVKSKRSKHDPSFEVRMRQKSSLCRITPETSPRSNTMTRFRMY